MAGLSSESAKDPRSDIWVTLPRSFPSLLRIEKTLFHNQELLEHECREWRKARRIANVRYLASFLRTLSSTLIGERESMYEQ